MTLEFEDLVSVCSPSHPRHGDPDAGFCCTIGWADTPYRTCRHDCCRDVVYDRGHREWTFSPIDALWQLARCVAGLAWEVQGRPGWTGGDKWTIHVWRRELVQWGQRVLFDEEPFFVVRMENGGQMFGYTGLPVNKVTTVIEANHERALKALDLV